jgi:hypothetical protein
MNFGKAAARLLYALRSAVLADDALLAWSLLANDHPESAMNHFLSVR